MANYQRIIAVLVSSAFLQYHCPLVGYSAAFNPAPFEQYFPLLEQASVNRFSKDALAAVPRMTARIDKMLGRPKSLLARCPLFPMFGPGSLPSSDRVSWLHEIHAKPTPFILQAVAGFFGVDFPDDPEREVAARQILDYLSGRWSVRDEWRLGVTLDDLLGRLRAYCESVTWVASGAQRFAPLGLAVSNMEQGRSIYDPGLLPDLAEIDAGYRFMQQYHLLYADPFHTGERWNPGLPENPHISFPQVIGRPVRWLDLGSAPKEHGSPTLRLLAKTVNKTMPQRRFEFHGIDVAFPEFVWAKRRPERMHWDYHDSLRGFFKRDGITYWDARVPRNDIRSNEFLRDKPVFDFVSACAVLHHLARRGEPRNFTSLADIGRLGRPLHWENETGQATDPQFAITESQAVAVRHMLEVLNTNGGILFAVITADMKSLAGHRNGDLFYVIQRVGVDRFRLYTSAIAYTQKPSDVAVASRVLTGHNMPRSPFNIPGLLNFLEGIDGSYACRLGIWMARADRLAYRWQRIHHSMWGQLLQGYPFVMADPVDVYQFFKEYLNHVPDGSTLKAEILRGVRRLENQRQRGDFKYRRQGSIAA